MKIIRRRRTITIETCAFRRWQTQGEEGSFNCPNCGMNFEQDPQLTSADTVPAGLLAGILADAGDPTASATNDAGSPCGAGCGDQTGGKTND